MSDIKGNLQKVYDTLKGEGYTDIGSSVDDFAKSMEKEENRKLVYDVLHNDGYTDIGDDYNAFSNLIYAPVEEQATATQTQEQASDVTINNGVPEVDEKKMKAIQEEEPRWTPETKVQPTTAADKEMKERIGGNAMSSAMGNVVQSAQSQDIQSAQKTTAQPKAQNHNFFRLRRGGKNFTVDTNDVEGWGGLIPWAERNGGLEGMRVYMKDPSGGLHHVDLAQAKRLRKEKGYKYAQEVRKVQGEQSVDMALGVGATAGMVQQSKQDLQQSAEATKKRYEARMENPFDRGAVKGGMQYNAETGKMEETYILPDGSTTFNKEGAEKVETKFQGQIDAEVEAQKEHARQISSGVDAVWDAANEEYSKQYVDSGINGSSDGFNNVDNVYQRVAGMEQMKDANFNFDKMADEVLKAVDDGWKTETLMGYETYFKNHMNEGKGKTAREKAENALRTEALQMIYQKAVKENAPKNVLDGLTTKIGENNVLNPKTWTNLFSQNKGLVTAQHAALEQWGTEHPVLNAIGVVGSMATDPLMWVAGPVGKGVGWAAMKLAGALTGKGMAIGSRWLGTKLGGRILGGVAGGAGNFMAYEGMSDIRQQMVTGNYNPETGETGGYDMGQTGGAMLHGLMLGGVTGSVAPVLGNVFGDWIRGTQSTIGKAGLKTGEYASAAVLEGTIFAAPELYKLWTDEGKTPWSDEGLYILGNEIGMMTAFKGHGMLKDAGKAIEAVSNRGRMSVSEVFSKVLDGNKFEFNDDNHRELRENGYGRLDDLLNGLNRGEDGKVSWDTVRDLINNPKLSRDVRAKVFYVATGKPLAPVSIVGKNIISNADGTVTVQSVGVTGEVMTSRTFASREKAKREIDNINRQTELNCVALGEQQNDGKIGDQIWTDAVKAVAPNHDAKTMLEMYAKNLEGKLSKGEQKKYGRILHGIDKWVEKHQNDEAYYTSGKKREGFKLSHGVDVDEALRKQPSERSEQEQIAIDKYMQSLGMVVEDPAVTAIKKEAEDKTHAQTGMIQPAVMKQDDRQVYITDGEVQMFDDGKGVDTQHSDESVFVKDKETGKKDMASPTEILRTEDPIDPSEEVNAAIETRKAEEQMAIDSLPEEPKTEEQIAEGEDVAVGKGEELVGSTIKVMDADGKEKEGYVTSVKDGEAEVVVDGENEPRPMSVDEIYKTNGIEPDVEPNGADGANMAEGATEVSEQPVTKPQRAIDRIPVKVTTDEKGNEIEEHDFESAEVDDTSKALEETFGKDEAHEAVDAEIAKYDAQIAELDKSRVETSGLGVSERMKAKEQNDAVDAQKAELEGKRKYWEDVKAELDKPVEETPAVEVSEPQPVDTGVSEKKESSATDNRMDTASTSKGMQNDTATLQDTASDGKDTTSSAEMQGNTKKSSVRLSEKEQRAKDEVSSIVDPLNSDKVQYHVYDSEEEIENDADRADVMNKQQRDENGNRKRRVFAWTRPITTEVNGKKVTVNHVFLMADNLSGANRKELAKTILHESVQHVGLKEMLGEKGFDRTMLRIWKDWMSDDAREEKSEYVWDQNYNAEEREALLKGAGNKSWEELTDEQRQMLLNNKRLNADAADEWAADQIETDNFESKDGTSWYGRLISELRNWLRAHGFGNIELTKDDLRQLWRKAEKETLGSDSYMTSKDNLAYVYSKALTSEGIDALDKILEHAESGDKYERSEKEYALYDMRDMIDNAIERGEAVSGLTMEQTYGARDKINNWSDQHKAVESVRTANELNSQNHFRTKEDLEPSDEKGLSMGAKAIKEETDYETPDEKLRAATRFSYKTMPDWGVQYIKDGKSPRDEEIVKRIARWYNNIAADAAVRERISPSFAEYGKASDLNKDGVGPLRGNVEYSYTFDMDTTCPRTMAFLSMSEYARNLLKRPMTIDEAQNLIEMMRANGLEIPCVYCYAENKRQALSENMLSYMQSRQDVINAADDAEAFSKMYGHKRPTDNTSPLTPASEKVMAEWRSKEGLSTYNPSMEQLYDDYGKARKKVMFFLDLNYKNGKINPNMSDKAIAKVICDSIIKDEDASYAKAVEASVRDIVNEWRYDAIEQLSAENPSKMLLHRDVMGREMQVLDNALAFRNVTKPLAVWDAMVKYDKSSSSAHNSVRYMPYTSELKDPKVLAVKDEINAMGGFRLHSSNDFRIDYVGDYLQFFADLAQGGWKSHSYSKSPLYVELFGGTGARINMSIAGYDVDGKVIENQSEGHVWKTAMELRKKYPNAGTMFMTTSAEQLQYALDADWVDMIIPFHSSGLPKRVWYNMRAWQDAQSTQNEAFYNGEHKKSVLSGMEFTDEDVKFMFDTMKEDVKSGSRKANTKLTQMLVKRFEDVARDEIIDAYLKGGASEIDALYGRKKQHKEIVSYEKDKNSGKMVKKVLRPHFLPGESRVEVRDEKGNKKKVALEGWLIDGASDAENIANYLRLCEEYGVQPRFHGITVKDKAGNDIPIEQHPGYIKLIKEAARIDSPQEAVKFNLDEPTEGLYKILVDENGEITGDPVKGMFAETNPLTGEGWTAMDYATYKLKEFAQTGGYDVNNLDPTKKYLVEQFVKDYIGKPLGYMSEADKASFNMLWKKNEYDTKGDLVSSGEFGEDNIPYHSEKGSGVKFRTTYHGSGADFDKFDHKHMGEGEGNQAFGWGTYVTDSEGVGRGYANSVLKEERAKKMELEHAIFDSKKELNDIKSELDWYGSDESARKKLERVMANLERTIANGKKIAETEGKDSEQYKANLQKQQSLEEMKKGWEEKLSLPGGYQKSLEAKLDEAQKKVDDAQNALDEHNASLVGKRHLYTVDIPDDTGINYLDWDKEYTKDEVDFILDNLKRKKQNSAITTDAWDEMTTDWRYGDPRKKETATGRDIYNAIAGRLGGQEQASKFLKASGLDGISYETEHNTGGNDRGDRNFVIFNESDAQITDHVRFRTAEDADVAQRTDGIRFSIRTKPAPQETRDVWKLMRLGEDGKLRPLYIDRNTQGLELGQWYDADAPNIKDLENLEVGSSYLIDQDGNVVDRIEGLTGIATGLKGKKPSKEQVKQAAEDGMRWIAVQPYKNGKKCFVNVGINGSTKNENGEGSVSGFAMRPGWHAGSLPSMKQISARSDDMVWVRGKVAYGNGAVEEAEANGGEINDHIPVDGGYSKATSSFNEQSVDWYISGAFQPLEIMSDMAARKAIEDYNKANNAQVPYDVEREGGKMFNAETREFDMPSEGGNTRFRFIGEKGASSLDKAEEAATRMDNLSVARKMEEEKKDALAIKMATGWERGADGKWRYEQRDGNLKDGWRNAKTVGEMWDDEPLFKAYPEFAKMRVTIIDNVNRGSLGSYNPETKSLMVNLAGRNSGELLDMDVRSTMVHELQHAIQHKEGFATGGSEKSYSYRSQLRDALPFAKMYNKHKGYVKNIEDWLKELKKQLDRKPISDDFDADWAVRESKEHFTQIAPDYNFGQYYTGDHGVYKIPAPEIEGNPENTYQYSWDDLQKMYDYYKAALKPLKSLKVYDESVKKGFAEYEKYKKRMTLTKDPWQFYKQLSGETEARNTEARMDMTDEERRNSLRSDTHDVADEDQIFLFDSLGESGMGSRNEKRLQEIGRLLGGRELTEQQRSVVDVLGGKANRKRLVVDGDNGHRSIIMQKGNERAGAIHTVYEHYNRSRNYITAEDVLHIPEIIAKGEFETDGTKNSYTKTIDNVEFTFATETKNGKESFVSFYSNREAPESENMLNTSADAHDSRSDANTGAKVANSSETANESAENVSTGKRFRVTDIDKDYERKEDADFSQRREGESLDEFRERATTEAVSGIRFKSVKGEWSGEELSQRERINKAKMVIAEHHKDDLQKRSDAVESINKEMKNINRLLFAQRDYDRSTVNLVADLAQTMANGDWMENATSMDVKRALSALKEANGREDITKQVDTIAELMVTGQLKKEQSQLEKLLKIKTRKQDATGVNVLGRMDARAVQVMEGFKKWINATPEDIVNEIESAQQNLNDSNEGVRESASIRFDALNLAYDYVVGVKRLEAEEAQMWQDLEDEKARRTEDRQSGKTFHYDDTYQSIYDTTKRAIVANRLDRSEALQGVLDGLTGVVKRGMEGAKAFREREQERINEIHHDANSDMQGVDVKLFDHQAKDEGIENKGIVNFATSSLATAEQIMRSFGGKSAGGEGKLFDRYIRGFHRAKHDYYARKNETKAQLNEIAQQFFGKKWDDVYGKMRKMSGVTVTVKEFNKERTYELSQGNAMYLYMLNKQVDGRMKLEHMGIGAEQMAYVEESLDPRVKAMADYMQSEYLVQKRNGYNDVHMRLFGAPMAEIDNYMPIKILSSARQKTDADLQNDGNTPLPSARTGAIIERKRNVTPIDLLGADGLSVLEQHLDEMDKWAATAEFNRDVATLLKYNRFENAVKSMRTIYGGGDMLWQKTQDALNVMTGSYKAKGGSGWDKVAMQAARLVTGAKVAFRNFTALKQTTSLPAFAADSDPVTLSKNLSEMFVPNSPVTKNTFTWAMENLPMFKERVEGRKAGDYFLTAHMGDFDYHKHNWLNAIGRGALWTNSMVDAMTCAVGARSVYETKMRQYKSAGLDKETAHERAVIDAEIAFNQSQQSSEEAYVSPMQVDRTVGTAIFTAFRNGPFGYGRRFTGAIKSLSNTMRDPSEMLRKTTNKWIAQGLDEESARTEAKKQMARQTISDIAAIALFGYGLQFVWNIMPSVPYLLTSDNDDEKKKILDEAYLKSWSGGVEGLAGGKDMSDIIGMALSGGDFSTYSFSKLPAASDVEMVVKEMGQDKWRATTDAVNLVTQALVGVNPQVGTDVVVATIDALGGDLGTSKEFALWFARVNQLPQSQIEKIYLDEVDMSVKDAQRATPQELAKRYAKYKVMRNAPLAVGFNLYDEYDLMDAENKQRKNIEKKMKERTIGGMASDDSDRYNDIAEQTAEMRRKIKIVKSLPLLEQAEEINRLRESEPELFKKALKFEQYDRGVSEVAGSILNAKDDEQRQRMIENMNRLKKRCLDDPLMR